jgi:hypothetical protein
MEVVARWDAVLNSIVDQNSAGTLPFFAPLYLQFPDRRIGFGQVYPFLPSGGK